MSSEEAILEKVRVLPPEKQQEVLDFVEFLAHCSIAIKTIVPADLHWFLNGFSSD